jgi:hypothetical protein
MRHPSVDGSVRARIAAALLLAFSLAAGMPALAQFKTLYKWTDRDGKVQYSDKPPVGFTGEIERLEIDPASNTTQSPRAPEAAAKTAPTDIAGKRRALREQLRAALDAARAKLELARASLAVAGGPDDDERQVLQQKFATQVPGTASARGNCRPIQQDGRVVFLCPTLVPNESYYERLGKLEEAVRSAEAEVTAAEEAYRRGVD